MITEKDIKFLKNQKPLLRNYSYWALIVLIVFLFIMGWVNIKLASKIGNNIEYNLGSLFQSWIDGIDIEKQYSGIYIKAMERLTTALLQFGMALIILIWVLSTAYVYKAKKEMNKRLFQTLRKCGAIKE